MAKKTAPPVRKPSPKFPSERSSAKPKPRPNKFKPGTEMAEIIK